MSFFVSFGLAGEQFNPDQIYKISRVVETVTFTVLVGGLPAGSLLTEDFVFANEADAIAAVLTFKDDAGRGPFLLEAMAQITGGISANPTTIDTLRIAIRDRTPEVIVDNAFDAAQALADKFVDELP